MWVIVISIINIDGKIIEQVSMYMRRRYWTGPSEEQIVKDECLLDFFVNFEFRRGKCTRQNSLVNSNELQRYNYALNLKRIVLPPWIANNWEIQHDGLIPKWLLSHISNFVTAQSTAAFSATLTVPSNPSQIVGPLVASMREAPSTVLRQLQIASCLTKTHAPASKANPLAPHLQ